MKVILASGSPRRKDLMNVAKIDYETIVSDFDEKVDTSLSLEEQSKEIAYGKAKDVFDNTNSDRAVIGADTLVICDGKQFGKPKNREEAINMLKSIQGRSHSLYTGLAVLIEENEKYKEYKELHEAKITVRKMSDEEIENYVDTENPYSFAGGYAIQGFFAVFIEKIEGDYSTILGFPIGRVYSILKENGII